MSATTRGELDEEQPAAKGIEFGRPAILEKIQNEARRRLTSKSEGGQGRGIELVDMGISRIEFVESVQQKTFDRWIAERQAIAALNVNEGERMKQEIINLAKANVERIEGEGQRKANEIRGNVDAEVIRKYAEAIEETGEFYKFVRLLEAYENGIAARYATDPDHGQRSVGTAQALGADRPETPLQKQSRP